MLAKEICEFAVQENTLALVWLGQAGFLIKTPGGKLIAIDPYLSDYAYHTFRRVHGYAFKRMAPALFQPGELHIDLLLCSHEHSDHLDMESLPYFLQDGTVCYTNEDGYAKIKQAGLPMRDVHMLRRGDRMDLGEVSLAAVDCDHGELAPRALGFLLDFGFTRVYYSGDTALTPSRLNAAIRQQPEVGLLPVNGAYGNMTGTDAAQLAELLGLKVCIPHHFWTFPAHGGDPMEAITAFSEHASACELRLLTPGEICVLNGERRKRNEHP